MFISSCAETQEPYSWYRQSMHSVLTAQCPVAEAALYRSHTICGPPVSGMGNDKESTEHRTQPNKDWSIVQLNRQCTPTA